MNEERERRLGALRSRVQRKLKEIDEDIEEEIVIHSPVDTMTKGGPQELDWWKKEIKGKYAGDNITLKMASWLIIAGSLLGILTGALLLNGNPDDLLNSSMFESSSTVDFSGWAIEAETGEGVEGVQIELLDIDSKIRVRVTETDSNGFYRIEDVAVKPILVSVSKSEYITVERVILPNQGGEPPFSMVLGEGINSTGTEEELDDSYLQGAVTISTVVAVLTLLTALLGFHAAFEARRGLHYRRTQYLAGVALCSRGMILFGPLLILMGMALLSLAKEQFTDIEDENGAEVLD